MIERRLRILPLAESDLAEAYRWYEGLGKGLGNDLLDAVDQCFQVLLEHPNAFQVIHKTVRRALIRRFPYCIYFTVTETEVIVLAVLHGLRDPRQWRKRI